MAYLEVEIELEDIGLIREITLRLVALVRVQFNNILNYDINKN